MKILVTGDLHIDAAKIGKIDPSTDLDLRTLDFLSAVERIIDYAIENKVDLFILNGDLFKGRTSTHLIESIIAEKLRRISDHMQLVINLGNHDYTAKSLAYGNHTYSIIEKLNLNNVIVNLELSHLQYDDVDIVLYPYYDCKTRVGFENNSKLISFVRDKIDSFDLNKECKLFIGHGTPEGTTISNEWFFDLDSIDEPVIPKDLLEEFDFSLFSHIHRTHYIGNKIFHVGSPERVDYSEADQDKGFSVYDTKKKKHTFISTNPRPMADLKIDLTNLKDSEDPTDKILNEISKIDNINESLIKIQIKSTATIRSTIDTLRLRSLLDKAYYYVLTYDSIQEVRETRLAEITETISEAEALEKVINSKSDLSEDDKKQLQIRGKGIIASQEGIEDS